MLGGAFYMNSSHFKNKKGNATKGFYIALSICIAAIGATAFTTYDTFTHHGKKKTLKSPETQSSQSSQQQTNNDVHGITITENKSFDDNVQSHFDPIQKSSLEDDQDNEVEVDAREENALIVYPCSKEVIKEYSGENPVFSKTMNDWRIHSGVDLKASQGDKVVAITNGTVSDIFEDPLLGKTIVIDHSNGIVAFYSGLGETSMVNKNDKVESGQEIGSINDIPSETLDGYHLHLAMKKDGKSINPLDILN